VEGGSHGQATPVRRAGGLCALEVRERRLGRQDGIAEGRAPNALPLDPPLAGREGVGTYLLPLGGRRVGEEGALGAVGVAFPKDQAACGGASPATPAEDPRRRRPRALPLDPPPAGREGEGCAPASTRERGGWISGIWLGRPRAGRGAPTAGGHLGVLTLGRPPKTCLGHPPPESPSRGAGRGRTEPPCSLRGWRVPRRPSRGRTLQESHFGAARSAHGGTVFSSGKQSVATFHVRPAPARAGTGRHLEERGARRW